MKVFLCCYKYTEALVKLICYDATWSSGILEDTFI